MITVVTCNNCGKDKGINYEFTITKWDKYCKECGNNPHHDTSFSFCSLRCSRLYIAKLEKHKCKEHYSCNGLQMQKDKIKKVWAACSICHKLDVIPYRKGMKIKGLERYNF